MLRQTRKYRALLGKSILIFMTGRQIKTGRQHPHFARSSFVRFLPVNLSFVAAFAALKVSLWRRMSADATGSLILTKRQHPRCAYACSNVFSSCCSFVFKVRFRGAKTNYMNFSNSARKTFLNVSLLSPRKNKKRCITSAMQRIFSFYVFTLCRPADNCAERIYDDKDECRHKDEQHL